VYRCGMSIALLLDAAAARLSRVRGRAGERRATGALVRSLWRQSSAPAAGGTEARS